MRRVALDAGLVPAVELRIARRNHMALPARRLEEDARARHPALIFEEIGKRQQAQLARRARRKPEELHVVRAGGHHDWTPDANRLCLPVEDREHGIGALAQIELGALSARSIHHRQSQGTESQLREVIVVARGLAQLGARREKPP